MAYRNRRSTGRRRNDAYTSRRSTASRGGYRSAGKRKAGRRSAGSREVRIVIEQAPANPVSRPAIGLMNTLLRAATPPQKKSKL